MVRAKSVVPPFDGAVIVSAGCLAKPDLVLVGAAEGGVFPAVVAEVGAPVVDRVLGSAAAFDDDDVDVAVLVV